MTSKISKPHHLAVAGAVAFALAGCDSDTREEVAIQASKNVANFTRASMLQVCLNKGTAKKYHPLYERVHSMLDNRMLNMNGDPRDTSGILTYCSDQSYIGADLRDCSVFVQRGDLIDCADMDGDGVFEIIGRGHPSKRVDREKTPADWQKAHDECTEIFRVFK